jgi:hypothetical protein
MPGRLIIIISLTPGGHKARPYERIERTPVLPDGSYLPSHNTLDALEGVEECLSFLRNDVIER